MDKKLKYSQLAKALGVSNASISMAIKNNKLIPEANSKEINIENPVNKLWIDNQIAAGKKFDINRIFSPANKPEKKTERKTKRVDIDLDNDEDHIPDEIDEELASLEKDERAFALQLKKLEFEKKKADLKKTKKETIKLDLQVKKIEGDLIPYDAVKTVFLYTTETFRTTYLQEVESLATIFMERLGGDHKHYVELQKILTEKINDIQTSTKENLLQGLKGIVAEYKEVRSRGESK